MIATSRRIAVVVVIALLGLGVAGWYAYLAIKAKLTYHTTFTYTLRVEFSTVPDNDRALEDWLRGQPGVDKASVTRQGKTITLEYQTDGDSLLQEILKTCETLGYKGVGVMNFNGQGFIEQGERKAPSR